MDYTILKLSEARTVNLCGTNVYPKPEPHQDRILQEHDLLYVFSGEQEIAQDDEVYTVSAGDMILLRAGSHHYGTKPCTINMRSIFIHFNVLPGDRREDYVSGDEAAAFAQSSTICLPTLIHCGQNNGATKILNAIIDLYWSHAPNKKRRLTMLLNLLLDELSSIALENRTEREEWSVAVISLFRKNTSKMYSLEELADIVHMNVRTLSTRFRQITGESVHQYQLNLKLEMAYRTLRGGESTVKEVALSYGFCDAYYFSRLFKKRFGLSPKQVKRDPSANMHRSPVV